MAWELPYSALSGLPNLNETTSLTQAVGLGFDRAPLWGSAADLSTTVSTARRHDKGVRQKNPRRKCRKSRPQIEICGYPRLTPSGFVHFRGKLVETHYPHKKSGRHLRGARPEMVNA